MDDLNMANAELAATLPPEANSGDIPPLHGATARSGRHGRANTCVRRGAA